MIIKKCQYCNKEFKTYPSLIGKFCSHNCYARWMSKYSYGENSPHWKGGNVERICQYCNEKFYVKPHVIRNGYGKFCSRKCMDEIKKGKNCSNWKGGKIKRNCPTCKKEFSIDPCQMKQNNFCSYKCYNIYNKGINHHCWRGGRTLKPYTINWTETLRQSIRERDKYTCQMCNMPQGDRIYSVHHTDYNKKNNNPDNLITLCASCHAKTNWNRKYWATYFK